MQTLSVPMQQAIRSSYQAPLARLEIYNQAGSLVGEILDVQTIEINVADSRKVLRTFQATVNNEKGQYTPDPDQYERNFLWYNKTIKVFYGFKTSTGDEWLPQGQFTLDYIKPEVTPTGITLEIGGQDLSSKMIEDRFDETYNIYDPSAYESANYALGGTASATSSVAAGDEIQTQARIHYIDTFATIGGIETKVINGNTGASADPERMINGVLDEGWLYRYIPGPSESVSKIEAEIFVDLQTAENVQQIDIQLSATWGGTLTDFVYLSPDNQTWTSYASTVINNPAAQVRYIKFRVRKTSLGSQLISSGGVASASTSYAGAPAANAFDGSTSTTWGNNSVMPSWLQYDCGSSKVVNSYKIYFTTSITGWDNYNYSPHNWEFKGSQDAINWTVLDTQSGQGWSSDGWKSYEINNSTAYKYYRLDVSASKNSVWCSIPELKLENIEKDWTLAVAEIKIKTKDNYTPGLSVDGNVYTTHWKPKALSVDPDPKITIDCGVIRTNNVIYLSWGNDSFDFWNRVKYFLEWSTDGSTWTRITDLNGLDESKSLFGDVEHCFDNINLRYIRINIKGRDGVAKLRHIKAQYINSTTSISSVITNIAISAGITQRSIPITRRFVAKKHAEIGDEKLHFCNLLAGSIGWVDLYMDENGVLKTGPRNINPVTPAWIFDVQTDNIFSFSPRFSNDIYNVIVVIGKKSDQKAIVAVSEDNDPLSPTYTGKLGRRVLTYEGDFYDTIEKASNYGRQKLFERTRFKHQTSLPVTAHPGLQHDDVVQVNVPEAKVEDQYYLVTGFVTRFDAESAEFNTTINISQL